MDIKAFKMDGLGNDFVIIDNRQKITNLTKDEIIKICDRNFVGCDQLILIGTDKSADANLKFYNSDGGESGACGNGTRCVADLISKELNNKSVVLKTLSGNLKSKILGNNIVTTEIGKAKIEWNEIPLSKDLNTQNVKLDEFEAFCLSIGNPHAVIFINNLEDLENLNINSIGPRLEKNSIFPEFANIEFVSVLEDKSLRMRVWERGAGMTSACGSGACATLVAASSLDKSAKENKIVLDGGDLFIKWLDNGSVTLSGDTERVFEGFIGE